MKHFPTQAEYLKAQGLPTKGTDPKILQAKKEYRKRYLREYRKRRKKTIKKITLRISPENWQKIKTQKDQHHIQSMNQFIIQSALAYLEKNYLPHNKQQQQELTKALQRIGTNINQVVHKLHQQLRYKSLQGGFDDSVKNMAKILVGYELLLERVEKLQKEVTSYLNVPPPTFMNLSWEDIRHDKSKLKQLVRFLLQHIDKL